MSTFFSILAPVTMLAVFASLCFGIYAMFRGGETSRTWSNRMMRARVVTQFLAILVLLGALLWKQAQGG